ncbi:MAG: transketolase C-terminal domain-containing protein [Pseudomonadota bacterium]
MITETLNEFAKVFGRKYQPVEKYLADDAETLILTMGSYSQTASLAVKELRDKGEKVGQIRLRLWRPFPFAELREAVKGAKRLIILDRAISYGGPGGPVASEVKSALYDLKDKPKIASFVGGLGGRDILAEQFVEMIKRGIEVADQGQKETFEMIGVK